MRDENYSRKLSHLVTVFGGTLPMRDENEDIQNEPLHSFLCGTLPMRDENQFFMWILQSFCHRPVEPYL